MPLPNSVPRREVHQRIIEMKAYARDDGMFDVEAHLVDTKPFDFDRVGSPQTLRAGDALHDLWVRLVVDEQFVVRDIQAASDITPYGLCKGAESTLKVLIGERIARGWSSKVKEKLRGTASCTHLMEVLIPLATAAYQGIRGTRTIEARRAETGGKPVQLDSCYAYSRHGEVVQRLWPQHYEQSDA